MQAVIPSVLTGFYKLTRSKEGAALFLRGNISTSWAAMLFGDKQPKVVSHIADYSGAEKVEVIHQIETAANEAAGLITANASSGNALTEDQIIVFMRISGVIYCTICLQPYRLGDCWMTVLWMIIPIKWMDLFRVSCIQ
jgi:hypothetical protein